MKGRVAVFAAAAVILAAASAPGAAAQALAAAGPGGALAGAGAPVPTPACAATYDVAPWGQPALLFGTPPGLLTANNASYSDVTLCCGGTISFSWTKPHGVYQISSRTCPAAFTNDPAAGQQQLQAVTANGTQPFRFPTAGTFFLTSQQGNDCAQGMLFAANVVGSCPGPGTGSQAEAFGSPGGTSTSTAPGAAAAASGPPGTSFTSTTPGLSYSSSGGRRRKLAHVEA